MKLIQKSLSLFALAIALCFLSAPASAKSTIPHNSVNDMLAHRGAPAFASDCHECVANAYLYCQDWGPGSYEFAACVGAWMLWYCSDCTWAHDETVPRPMAILRRQVPMLGWPQSHLLRG